MGKKKNKETVEVADSIEETCPFCKKKFIIGFDKKGDVRAFLHSLPPCQKFIELDPAEYLRQVNIALGAHN